jgi:chromosome segregation ATPase
MDELALKRKQESIRAKARLFESRVEAERYRIQQEDARLQQELRDVEEELARLKREREVLFKNIHDLTAARMEADQVAKQLESDIAALANRVSSLVQRKSNYDEQLEQIQKVRLRKQEQLDKENDRLRSDTSKVTQLQSKSAQLQRDRAETADRVQTQFARMQAQAAQLDKLRRELQSLGNQLHAHAERQADQRATYRQLVQQRKSLLDELRSDITSLLDAAYARLGEKRIEPAAVVPAADTSSSLAELNHYKALMVQRESELTSTKDSLAHANQTLASLQRQLDEQRVAHDKELQAQRRAFAVEKESLQSEVRDLEQKLTLASIMRDASGMQDAPYGDAYGLAASPPAATSTSSTAGADSELLRAKEEELAREQEARKKLYSQLKQLRLELNAKTSELQETQGRMRELEREAKQASALVSALGIGIGGGSSSSSGSPTTTASGSRNAVETLYSDDTVAALEQELVRKDNEITSLTTALGQAQSDYESAASNLASLQTRVRQQIDEIKAKDASITSLSSIVRGIDTKSTQQTDLGQLQREIGRLRMAVQAHQLQNSELEYEVLLQPTRLIEQCSFDMTLVAAAAAAAAAAADLLACLLALYSFVVLMVKNPPSSKLASRPLRN